MEKLFQDLSKLLKNNWKIILTIIVVLGILSNYSEIKKGIKDGWFEYESTKSTDETSTVDSTAVVVDSVQVDSTSVDTTVVK